MKAQHKLTLSGAAAVLATAQLPAAFADQPSLERLQSEVQSLRQIVETQNSELNAIRASNNENWLTERRAQEVKSLVNEVLSDAETRASLLQDGMTAGYDGRRFFLASADGSVRINIGGQLQFRYIYNNRNDATGNGAVARKDDTLGFQFRRAKLTFDGHIGDPKIQYRIRFIGNRNNGSAGLEEAFVRYQATDWLSVYAGRLKAPFSRDELVGSAEQLAVERSVVDNQFSWARTEGAGFTIQPFENLKIDTMINNGPTRNANDFSSGFTTFAIASRAEWLILGSWNQFRGYNSWTGEDLGLLLGGAVGYVQDQASAITASPVSWGNSFSWTVDAGLKWNGLSIAAAGYGQHLSPDNANSANRYGALAQVGYNIDDTIEPFGRYEYIDNTDLGFSQKQHIVTVGATYFIKKNSVKFSLDAIYLFEGSVQTGVATNTGQGLLPSTSDQFAIRGQFQLLF